MKTTRRTFIHRSSLVTSALAIHDVLLPRAFVHAAEPEAHRVKIGVFGTSHSHASGKVAALRKLTDLYEVVGVVEPDEIHRRKIESQGSYEGLKFLSEEQLLNLPGLQAVIVERSVKDLVPAATRFASAGLHVHLEKPGGPSLPAFRNLLELMKQKGRILQMGYMFRRNPAFEFCFQAARDGWLGELSEVHGIMGKVAGAGERKGMAEFPGGTMFELGCHLIDAMVTLLGKPDQVIPTLRRTHPEKDDLADNTLAVFEYPKALATVASNANDVEGNSRRMFSVRGDRGAATILPLESPVLALTLDRPQGEYKKGTQVIPLPKMPGRFDDQLTDFARIIRGEKKRDYTPEHDLAVLETVLRASGMPTE
jgi:predicted dehydrogenase